MNVVLPPSSYSPLTVAGDGGSGGDSGDAGAGNDSRRPAGGGGLVEMVLGRTSPPTHPSVNRC